MSRRRGHSAQHLVGELEYEALKVLWDEAPTNVATVLRAVNTRRRRRDQLAYTTVMTVLSRLYDKALLDRTKVGRGYVYTPRFDEPSLVTYLGQREVDDLLDRFGSVALAHFAAALEKADPQTIQRMRELTREPTDG